MYTTKSASRQQQAFTEAITEEGRQAQDMTGRRSTREIYFDLGVVKIFQFKPSLGHWNLWSELHATSGRGDEYFTLMSYTRVHMGLTIFNSNLVWVT